MKKTTKQHYINSVLISFNTKHLAKIVFIKKISATVIFCFYCIEQMVERLLFIGTGTLLAPGDVGTNSALIIDC